jgi:hypothetical protein
VYQTDYKAGAFANRRPTTLVTPRPCQREFVLGASNDRLSLCVQSEDQQVETAASRKAGHGLSLSQHHRRPPNTILVEGARRGLELIRKRTNV